MKRSTRTVIAQETLTLIEQGHYVSPAGKRVELTEPARACLEATRYFEPEEVARFTLDALAAPSPALNTVFEVVNETTLQGIARAVRDGAKSLAALNFASAKNAGGGFLNGSQAQEESLARSSALYPSLLRAPAYYSHHRATPSLLYSDRMVVSPACPILRDDAGTLLEDVQLASFITSAAPNAGAIAQNRPDEAAFVEETLRRRSAGVLAVAATLGYSTLVLGAWGCGVFRNDPKLVAGCFATHLRAGGGWFGRFERIIFSVLDADPAQETFNAFESAFA